MTPSVRVDARITVHQSGAIQRRFTFAMAVPRHTSHCAARFAALMNTVFPGHIEQIFTDNGSEFQEGFWGAFGEYAATQGWRRCYTCPRSPRMNAVNERFNRTIQEEFVDYEENLSGDDPSVFNLCLLDDLSLVSWPATPPVDSTT